VEERPFRAALSALSFGALAPEDPSSASFSPPPNRVGETINYTVRFS
jgi:hypothetical protein